MCKMRLVPVVLISLLLCSLTACARQEIGGEQKDSAHAEYLGNVSDPQAGDIISSKAEDSAESGEASGSDRNEMFGAVLLGDSPFVYCSGGNTETMVVTDVPALFDGNDPFMKIWEFALVDLDGDGEDEVILFVAGAAGDMGGKLILHQIGDEVYGYATDNRTLVDLKTDGTYGYSDPTGVTEAGIAVSMDFSETGYTADKMTYATGTYDGWDTFVVNHQTGTEEEYLDALSRQDQKQNAEWYEFSDENINSIF